MRLISALLGTLALATTGFAGTTYDNFTGYSSYWNSLGNPNTATYGELFTAPSNGDSVLQSFSFYMGTPTVPGDIILGGYIGTWTGTQVGTVVYSSPQIDYDNLGNEQLTFSPSGLSLSSGGSYVAFLSVSEYYGSSSGETHVSQGSSVPGLNGFVYINNYGNASDWTNTAWAGPLTPDWAVGFSFSAGSATPEPGSVMLLCGGLLALAAVRRKRTQR